MALASGDRLGPYVVTGSIGAGGMGEVYRARDPRLNRDVAIKILRASAMGDPDWRARFTQEARAVSALNHPNIVTIHDVGSEGDVTYMVMELVDGQPLDRAIPSGGMRVGDVLQIGAQIADACARAHAGGIIHRDLKPANVMVQPDGRVRVLDFGIAKLLAAGSDGGTAAPDATGTSPGLVLGTAAYMSPEQAEGRPVDARSDIFSLGAMLYEMSTGQRPFKGDSPVTVMAAILQQEPAAPNAVRAGLPLELVRLVMRCLRKDPARRVQSMADLKVALEELRDDADSGRLTVQTPAAARNGRRALALVAIAAAVIVAAAGFVVWRTSRPSAPAAELQPMPLTTFAGLESEPTLSPDGSQVAFRWNGEKQDNSDIYVMLIGGGSPLRLTTDPRTDYGPHWSPDGRRIAFLRVLDRGRVAAVLVPPLGGPERTIGEFWTTFSLGGGPIATLCWTADSRYLFLSASEHDGQPNSILRVTVDTGDVLAVAVPTDKGRGFLSPDLSPDGRTLAMAHLDAPDAIELVTLSDAFEPRSRRGVAGHNVGSVRWTPDGRDLLITYFLALPLPLFRVPASGGEATPLSWVGPGAEGEVAFHGTRMVFSRSSRDTNLVRLDLRSAAGGTPVLDRIAQSSFRDVAPEYSPDGTRLAFYSNRSGSVQIWTSNADGSQPVQLTTMDPLATTGTPRWSPDGRNIAFDSNAEGQYHVYVVPSSGGRPRLLTPGTAQDYCSVWSPDGRWVYFSSNRTGTEIWRVAPEGGTPEQVTHEGGSEPRISRDGKWLFFTKSDGADGIWRMPIDGGTAVKLVDHVFRYNFSVVDGGVYYIVPEDNARSGSLRFFDLATGTNHQILHIDKPLDLGLAVSPDGRYLLFAQMDYAGQDLMIVENFK